MNIIKHRIKLALTDDERMKKMITILPQMHPNLLTYSIRATIMLPKEKTKSDVEQIIKITLKEMILNACKKFNEKAEVKLAYPQNVQEISSDIRYKPYNKQTDRYKSAELTTAFKIPLLASKLSESDTFKSIIHESKNPQDAWQKLCNNWLGRALNAFENALQQVPNKDDLRQNKIQFILSESKMTYK